uniref:Uncharacterized protein n=1 Tax=Anguilla anguilla TaxID=7936 RepID=A0A0E9RQ01_ANGAN
MSSKKINKINGKKLRRTLSGDCQIHVSKFCYIGEMILFSPCV